MKEKKLINRTLLVSWLIIVLVFIGTYSLEYVKRQRSLGYLIVFLLFTVTPLLVAFLVNRKEEESSWIPYLTVYGYFGFYLFALFTGNTELVFTYILPLFALFPIIQNVKLTTSISAATVIVNLLYIVLQFTSGREITAMDITNYEIRMGLLVMAGVFSNKAVQVSIRLSEYRMNTIQEKEKSLEAVLSAMGNAADNLTTTVHEMDGAVQNLTLCAESNTDCMRAVIQGVEKTNADVQQQVAMTEVIQQNIEEALTLSDKTVERMQETAFCVNKGMDSISKLNDGAKESEQKSERVLQEMNDLNNKMQEVLSIIQMISTIAGQTNLLALNASIEAARAGEAGRGFAVVAEEINHLASETKSAANSIQAIVESLQIGASNALEAVNGMTELTTEQNQSVYEAREAFDEINGRINEMSEVIKQQMRCMNELQEGNTQVVNSTNAIAQFCFESMSQTEKSAELGEKHQQELDNVISLTSNVKVQANELLQKKEA